MMYIEFPDDADNDISYVDEDSNIVEVRITIENSSYAFVLLLLFLLVDYFGFRFACACFSKSSLLLTILVGHDSLKRH